MSNYPYQSLLCPTESVNADQLETDRKILAFERVVRQVSRRRFLGTMLGATAPVTVAGSGKAYAQTTAAAPPIVDVLNFALNLEYLEANFYLYATTAPG